ncbi:MAG: hypothetical protein U0575_09810 [Phycisphaerales bacterium]
MKIDSFRSTLRSPAFILAAALSLVGAALLPGCTPQTTYPPTAGTGSFQPWVAPVPQVMAASLRYTHDRHAPKEELVFNLPPGVPEWVWVQIQKDLGAAARPMMPQDTRGFSVLQVRIDGANAECDVIYPAADDLYQMITVGLTTNPFQEWRPTFERKWRIPATRPTSNWGVWTIQEHPDYPNMNPQPWEDEGVTGVSTTVEVSGS